MAMQQGLGYLLIFWTLTAGAVQAAVAQAQDLVQYSLRTTSQETSPYRTQSKGVFGDTVHAAPLLVLGGEDFKYDFLPPRVAAARDSYRSFLQLKKKRQGQVFFPSNDGNLHAFNADSGDQKFFHRSPKHQWSMHRTGKAGYANHPFLTGPLVEADIYDSRITASTTVSAWRNVLIGSSGAGARNLFAIQVPVPSQGDNKTIYAPSAADLLWEIDSSDSHFSDLGSVLQKPALGMMRDGTWVVIVGNGYVDDKGTAKLFIINALTGACIKSIALPGSAPNGLGGVRLVLDTQRQITAAYAGDLQGNLWKFDFSSERAADWGLAFGNTALYRARDATDQVEPITLSPTYVAHPQGGNLVLFGTGTWFAPAHAKHKQVQSLYGVWDRVITGQNSGAVADAISTGSSGSAATGATSKLVRQSLSAMGDTAFYRANNRGVNYKEKRGWFIRLDMAPRGLRLAVEPQLTAGKVFFQLRSPMDGGSRTSAAHQGKLVHLVLDPLTGSAASAVPAFEVYDDGFTESGNAVARAGPIRALASNKTGSASFSQRVGTGVLSGAITSANGQTTVAGEKTMLRRSWRQIINRPAPVTTPKAGGG